MEVNPQELKRVHNVKLWLCNRLRTLRQARGYTQEEVGNRMGGLIKTRISDFEHCLNDYKFSTVARYAHALGIPLESVFKGCPGWYARQVKSTERMVITSEASLIKRLTEAGMHHAKAKSLAATIASED